MPSPIPPLREFGPPIIARLTEAEAAALQECPAGLEVRLTREPGAYALRAAQFVGTVVLPNRTVHIVPKVSVDRLLYLLGFAPKLMKFSGTTRYESMTDLVVAMKTMYASALEQLLV